MRRNKTGYINVPQETGERAIKKYLELTGKKKKKKHPIIEELEERGVF